jgi:FKBP-type peptidyl-prolyl cis-trans isomerase
MGHPKPGDLVEVQYRGKLKNGGQAFHDTYLEPSSVAFRVNQGQTISGLDEGVQQMVLGEKARLEIASKDAYGDTPISGNCGPVPPNSTIVLDVLLIRMNEHHPRPESDGCWVWRVACCCCRILCPKKERYK